MYYFSNIQNISPGESPYQTRKLSILQSSTGVFDYYQLNSPFILQFETSHPESQEACMVFTSLAPETSFYSVLSIDDKHETSKYRRLHQHDYFELVFVLEGELYQLIENHRHLYTAGSCCLLNRNIRHTEELSTNFRAVFVAMSFEFLYDLFHPDRPHYFEIERENTETILEKFLNFNETTQIEKGYMDFILQKDLDWVLKDIHSIFEQISLHIINPGMGSSLMIKGLFYKLLNLLNTPENYQTTPIRLGSEAEAAIFNEITAVVKDKHGRISRNELAYLLNYSGDYLNKIVKKFTGLSIFDYGMSFCLNEAAKLLLETNLSISDIAVKLKFSNRAHFYKLFEEAFGMTPKEYRKQRINKQS